MICQTHYRHYVVYIWCNTEMFVNGNVWIYGYTKGYVKMCMCINVYIYK